jgi:hypothetical protein
MTRDRYEEKKIDIQRGIIKLEKKDKKPKRIARQ